MSSRKNFAVVRPRRLRRWHARKYARLAKDLEKPIGALRDMVLDPRLFGHAAEG